MGKPQPGINRILGNALCLNNVFLIHFQAVTHDTTATTGARRRRAPQHAAEKVFFPAAALYGGAAVPLSVHGFVSGNPLAPGLGTVAGHAHELLFGFALAVAAGFLINRTSTARLSVLFAVWLLARALYVTLPGSTLALVANIGFAVMLAWLTVPQFLRGAKKWRNKAIAPILLGLCAMAALFHAASVSTLPWLPYLALQEAVLLLTLLMLFMGGRIIAPAAAGAIERAGGLLEARVQPRIEGALLILMAALIIAAAIPGAEPLAALLALTAAVLAGIRLARWRLWAATGRPDLWCLGLGYGWLAAGLALLALSWITPALPQGTATHAITVGALGTLTTGVMARVRLNRARQNPAAARTIPLTALLVGTAALVRLLFPAHPPALAAASGLWALAMAALVVLFARVPAR